MIIFQLLIFQFNLLVVVVIVMVVIVHNNMIIRLLKNNGFLFHQGFQHIVIVIEKDELGKEIA